MKTTFKTYEIHYNNRFIECVMWNFYKIERYFYGVMLPFWFFFLFYLDGSKGSEYRNIIETQIPYLTYPTLNIIFTFIPVILFFLIYSLIYVIVMKIIKKQGLKNCYRNEYEKEVEIGKNSFTLTDYRTGFSFTVPLGMISELRVKDEYNMELYLSENSGLVTTKYTLPIELLEPLYDACNKKTEKQEEK